MDINSIGGSSPSPSSGTNDARDSAKADDKRKAQEQDNEKRKREEELMNPVDRSLIADKTNIGANIAASIIMGAIGAK